MSLIVHHLNHSRSQRLLWLLEELQLPYEIRFYERNKATMLAPPELKKVHPLGKSPVITDGDEVIAESGAILEYLVERHGEGRFVPPVGTPEHLRYRYWMHYAEGSLMSPLLMKLVFILLLARAMGATTGVALRTGLYLAQAGEFGFVLLTLGLGVSALATRLDPGFNKLIPLSHPYMAAFKAHGDSFSGANRILVSLHWKGEGDLYNQEFLEALREVTEFGQEVARLMQTLPETCRCLVLPADVWAPPPLQAAPRSPHARRPPRRSPAWPR